MRIPDEFLKGVVFIGVEIDAQEKKIIKWSGTGFFVSLESENYKGNTFVYLVTARHVIAGTAGRNFFIRVNTKDGKSVIIEVAHTIKWFFHPDDTQASDVAVYPVILTKETWSSLDYTAIALADLMTEEARVSWQYGVGDEVYIIGLFALHAGTEKNLPVLRTGNLAMIPDEPVPTTTFGNMEVYLIEARSIRGLSGSPVIIVKPITPERSRFHLLGLIHGHWDVPQKSPEDSSGRVEEKINVGIAMVTPAKKIYETIKQSAMDKARAEIEKWQMGHSKT